MDVILDTDWEDKFLVVKEKLAVAQAEYDAFLKTAQTSLEKHGETSVAGNTLSLTIVERGPRWKLSKDVPIEFITLKESLDLGKVETYLTETGKLPMGVIEVERTKTITPFIKKG